MALLYFAYGSNLKRERLVERVPGARVRGNARLDDHRLACDKRGADGSGKANLRVARGERVWGVVYELPAGGFEQLDAYERGYRRVPAAVLLEDLHLEVTTYRSDRLTDDPVPFAWYRMLILEGAREHGLPADWLDQLERLPFR